MDPQVEERPRPIVPGDEEPPGQPLGLDTPEAREKARKLAAAWDEARGQRDQVTTYPAGTFGAYWDRLRGTRDMPSAWWSKKGVRTREDYERAWKHIDAWRPTDREGRVVGPTLSRTVFTKITSEHCEHFYAHMQANHSASKRWRTIKALKILLADMVVRLRLPYASPAAKLVNSILPPRWQIWLASEVEDLAAGAAIAGFEGLSLGIELAWETMFSPVDIWTLRPSELKRDAQGWYVEADRAKTGRQAFAAISDQLGGRLQAYLKDQDRNPADNTPILRQRDGHAYRTKDTFGGDFRDVRAFMFPGDTGKLMDIRRSANVEADAADKKTMGELLANGLAENRFLDQTYTPPTVTKAREVAVKRLEGRAKSEAEVTRVRATNG